MNYFWKNVRYPAEAHAIGAQGRVIVSFTVKKDGSCLLYTSAWKATKTTGQFDLKTFEVKASPVEKVENLRPGMSVIIDK